MDMKIKGFNGMEQLEKALSVDAGGVLDGVVRDTLTSMYNRSVQTSDPGQGGTPWKTGELAKAVNVTEDAINYVKEYAPHVEYGHRMKNGGFVEGRKFLKRNVEIEKPLYIARLETAVAKLLKGK